MPTSIAALALDFESSDVVPPPVGSQASFDAVVAAARGLNFWSSAAEIESVDRALIAEFQASPRRLRDAFEDVDFASGAPIRDSRAFDPNPDSRIRAVAFCFRARLRLSLAHVLDTLALPVDGAYFPRRRGTAGECETPLDTLLAGCLRRLNAQLAKGAPIKTNSSESRYALVRAFSPYVAIAHDLVARGAGVNLRVTPGGDYAVPSSRVGAGSGGMHRPALHRAWQAFLHQPEGLGIPLDLIRTLIDRSSPHLVRFLVEPQPLDDIDSSDLLQSIRVKATAALRALAQEGRVNLAESGDPGAPDSGLLSPLFLALSQDRSTWLEVLLDAGSAVTGIRRVNCFTGRTVDFMTELSESRHNKPEIVAKVRALAMAEQAAAAVAATFPSATVAERPLGSPARRRGLSL